MCCVKITMSAEDHMEDILNSHSDELYTEMTVIGHQGKRSAWKYMLEIKKCFTHPHMVSRHKQNNSHRSVRTSSSSASYGQWNLESAEEQKTRNYVTKEYTIIKIIKKNIQSTFRNESGH